MERALACSYMEFIVGIVALINKKREKNQSFQNTYAHSMWFYACTHKIGINVMRIEKCRNE